VVQNKLAIEKGHVMLLLCIERPIPSGNLHSLQLPASLQSLFEIMDGVSGEQRDAYDQTDRAGGPQNCPEPQQ
jgi:hypothetical protein